MCPPPLDNLSTPSHACLITNALKTTPLHNRIAFGREEKYEESLSFLLGFGPYFAKYIFMLVLYDSC